MANLFLFVICLIVLGSSAMVVPFVPHDSFLLHQMNMTGLDNVVAQVPRVLVFVHDSHLHMSHNARFILQRAIPLFSDDLVFVEVDSLEAKNLTLELSVSAPRLVFYRNTTLWAHYSFPSSETFLLHLLNFLATDVGHRPATTWEEIYHHLGASYASLVYPSNETIMARLIHRQLSGTLGSIDLVPFATRSADDLGLRTDKFYLFRLDDVYLQEIDKNATDLVRHLKPLFKRFYPDDITRGNLIFGIASDHLNKDIVDILTAVAESFPNYSVGFLNPSLHSFVNMSVGGTLESFPAIAVFNVSARHYLPVPPELRQLKNQTISIIIESIKKYLTNPPEFVSISEPESAIEQGENFVKLIGTTYDHFVNDASIDVVVLYVSLDNQLTSRYLSVFKKAAARAIGTSVKFGVINATSNAAKFPSLPILPHIEIFPANKKADHQTFFGRLDEDAILRFVKRYGTSPNLTFQVSEETERDRSFELMQIWKAKNSMDEGERRKANDRLAEIQAASKKEL